MTTAEQKAAVDLIYAIREARNSLEMAAAVFVGYAAHSAHRITEDDLTFAMQQASIVSDNLRVALTKCREANHEAHRLVRCACGNSAKNDGHGACPRCGEGS